MDFFYFYFVFFFVLGAWRGLSALGSLAFRPGFGFLVSLASWFSVSGLLIAVLSCTACWLLGFLGFLAFRPLDLLASRLLYASCIILYYVVLNYIHTHTHIYIYCCIIFQYIVFNSTILRYII